MNQGTVNILFQYIYNIFYKYSVCRQNWYATTRSEPAKVLKPFGCVLCNVRVSQREEQGCERRSGGSLRQMSKETNARLNATNVHRET